MLVIKFQINKEHRRFRVEENLDFNTLCSKLSQIVARPDQKLTDLFYLQYMDDEGDIVYITSTMELEEAIRLAKEQHSILRLNLIPITSKAHVSRPVSPCPMLVGAESNVKEATNSETPTPKEIVTNCETPIQTETPTPFETPENLTKEPDPKPKRNSLADSIALTCTKVSSDVVRACGNPSLVEKCASLSTNTTQQCNLNAGQVQQSTSNFSGKTMLLCSQTAEDCVGTMQPLYENTIAIVDRETQNVSSIMKSLTKASDMKTQCLATSKMLEAEVDQFHRKFLPTLQECKKLQSTCDGLRTELTKQCSDLSTATRDKCVSLSNNITATIMAI